MLPLFVVVFFLFLPESVSLSNFAYTFFLFKVDHLFLTKLINQL